MTRRQERRRRVGGWLALQAAGLGVAALAGATLPGGALCAALALAATLAIGHARMIAPPGTAILTYHSVSPDPAWLPWSRETAVHPETFARHLATLAAMRVPVLATRTYLAMRAGGDVPGGAVILHFDDGYRDNHRFAAPLLRRYAMPATFFPSLDFIEPEDSVRQPDGCEGYMRWSELAELEADPLFEVEPHGVDHGRVPTSDRPVTYLTPENWRAHAWLQWAATPGSKHDWFRRALPKAVPIGAPVPESGLALAERGWRGGTREPEERLDRRIAETLIACRDAFADRLGITPQVFCWPENKVAPHGRAIAAALGYRATTAGCGRNTAQEPAAVLSRIHIGDRAVGVRWPAMEALALRAAVRLMHGNLYWYLLVAPMNRTRAVVMRLRDRLGGDFA